MDGFIDGVKLVFGFIWDNLIYINMLFAIIVVFFQRKEPKSAWAWLLILYFVPIIGFVFYMLAGTDMHKLKLFRNKEVEDRISEIVRRQEYHAYSGHLEKLDPRLKGYSDMVLYNLETQGAMLSSNNDIKIFSDGVEKFNALKEDMRNAKEFIHLQYYIIKKDEVFEEIVEILEEKVKEGVEVRVLYDAMGCRSVFKKYWKSLNEKGIQTAEFFPAFFGKINLRVNYRNHRKIAVIDNKIGYVGGFNVAKEYIGKDEKIGYWRDTHYRLCGGAVASLHLCFLMDWNYAAKQNLFKEPKYMQLEKYDSKEKCEVQIISSGPDSQLQNIRNNYLRLISKAEKSIYIQTPYFIPDEAVLSALVIAIHSGIEVHIMIPCKPDHLFVYEATCSYVGELVNEGAQCYTYDNGFLHAKVMTVDDKVSICGTANMDIRSYALNFEVAAVVYDENKAREMRLLFEEDVKLSTRITKDMYRKRSLWFKFRERISRMLSPVL